MFCPKCGAILVGKKDGSRKVMSCSCGYSSKDLSGAKIRESLQEGKKVEVLDREDYETLPVMKAECPKCRNNEAYFWTMQTRAGDEPETKFLKCKKCKHTWRDYD